MIELAQGTQVSGYRIERFLGRGGFASVYLATDNETGEKVALKMGALGGGGRYVTRFHEVTDERSISGISPDEVPGDAVFIDRDGARFDFLDCAEIDALLEAEAELLDHTKSTHMVHLRKVEQHEGRPVLVLDYVRGHTLREKIRAGEGIRLQWFQQLTEGLLGSSENGAFACHGDLKPENIIITPAGNAVMLDPGRKGDGYVATTALYNPLLLRDERSDVMAIGIMIYEILTGCLPFDEAPWEYAGRESSGETARMSLSYFLSYPAPSVLNPKTPAALERLIYRCLTVPEYGLEGLRKDLLAYLKKA